MSHSRTFKAAMLGSSKFVIKASGVLAAAVLARVLTKVDYAAYRQTILAFRFVEPFLLLGLGQALVYFIPRDRGKARSILTGNLLMLTFMGFVFTGAMWCGGNELLARRFSNPALKNLLLIYSPYAILALPLASLSACLVSCDRVKTLAIYNIVSRVIALLCVIGLVLIWRTPEAAISGILIGAAIVVIPGLILMYRAVGGIDWVPRIGNMWDQLKFSVPLGVAGLFGILALNLDKVLVSSLCPPEDFAVYVNGAVEIPLIGVITGSVLSILVPEFSAMFKRGESKEVIELWQRAMVKCAILIFPLMIYLMIMAPEVMRVLFSAKYVDSAVPFRIYLLILPVRITQFGAVLMAAGKNPLILFNTVVSLVLNLVLSIILIKMIGFLGAAIATVIVLYIWAVPFFTVMIGRASGISSFRVLPCAKLLKIGAICFFSGLLSYGLSRLLPDVNDIFRMAIIGLFYGGILLGLFLISGVLTIKSVKEIFNKILSYFPGFSR